MRIISGTKKGHSITSIKNSEVRSDSIGDEIYKDFKTWDLGDIVGIEGTLFKTKTDELTVNAESVCLLTKSLRPL